MRLDHFAHANGARETAGIGSGCGFNAFSLEESMSNEPYKRWLKRTVGPESQKAMSIGQSFQPEYLDYCPNADVSIWFRLLDKWLPAFFVSVGAVFILGMITNTLHPTLIFLAKTLLVPLKPILKLQPTQEFSNVVRFLSMVNQPLFLLLGIWVAKLTLDQKSNPNLIFLGGSGIEITLRKDTSEAGVQWISKKFVSWQDVTKVSLVRPQKKRSNLDYEILIHSRFSSPMQIRYGDIISPWHRMKFLDGLNRMLPNNVSCQELLDVFGSPTVRQSYTEIWLRELAAAPKRDKLTPLAPGSSLQEGAYKIVEKLGMGGQATVYLARSTKLPVESNMVALKEFMLPVFPDPKVRMKAAERFQVEAEMLARLQHPQIIRFYDLFIEDHRAYLVMERAEGENLKTLVQKHGPLKEREVARLAWQMCGLLNFLHNNKPPITHRDFTPDNLILNSDGMLKLIDFSVARQVETTVTGSVVGKPNFMAPEQFRGKPEPKSDIYSLGASMYFLLTGKEPEAILTSHLGPAFSKSMNEIVARATAIEPEDRFETAADMSALLESFLAEPEEGEDGAVLKMPRKPQLEQN